MDRVYVQLEKSARAAQALAREGHGRGRLGHEGGLVERDAMVFQAAKRIAQLDAAHEGLVFGRLDLRPELDPRPALHRPDRAARRRPRLAADRLAGPGGRGVLPGDRRRRRTPSYAAACCAAPGATVRRASRTSCSTPTAETDLPIVGEGALMAQLSRARDRSMHSIVATIQAEQDRAIRAPGKGVVSISGGPGTGKTVVALHRAAYLLYTDRRRYEGGGVLIVGPSGVFMRYIERVLPSLGETAVALRSLGEVVDGVRADPARRAGGRRREGLGPDGRADAADGAAAGARQPTAVPGLLARRRDRARPRDARPDPALADVAGPAQPAAAAGRLGAARRDVAPGRAASAAASAAARRSTTRCCPTRRSSTSPLAWWPPLDAATVLGWLRDPELLARVGDGRGLAGGPAAAAEVVGRRRDRSRSRTCRCSTSCATPSATSRPGTRTTTSSTTTSAATCRS